ncbi:MAG: TlyA family RNA methyltransferase [Candidatus Saccharibacteria bacterium]|nr:TlyA family RNA methyltransferase [Candidatus Saccharibacteria bacterium]
MNPGLFLMMKQRLDKTLVMRGLATTRSQAENYIRLGKVMVNGELVQKAGHMVGEQDVVRLQLTERYVSRAGLKLASVASAFALDFRDRTVLDIGSSTGGFTDYALQHGAKKVFAVDVGTDQLHPSLRGNEQISLHEKTDIREFYTDETIDLIVGDVSFISLREILPHVAKHLMRPETVLAAMVKPQFEAGRGQTNKGVVKNNAVRRQILAEFEMWARQYFVVLDKKDSDVAGSKGNVERFYKLRLAARRAWE